MGVTTNPAVVGTSAPTMSIKIDEASATVTYIGKASVGSAGDAAGWQIARFTVAGTETACEYADGDANYDNVWDDRASLNYS